MFPSSGTRQEWFLLSWYQQVCIAVTLLTCLQELLGSNHCRDSGRPQFFRSFPSHSKDMPFVISIMLRSPSSTSLFTIHASLRYRVRRKVSHGSGLVSTPTPCNGTFPPFDLMMAAVSSPCSVQRNTVGDLDKILSTLEGRGCSCLVGFVTASDQLMPRLRFEPSTSLI